MLRVRSTPDFALDHDVGEVEASRVRSPPYCAFDHDFLLLRGAVESELRSAESACFRDHDSTFNSAPSPGPTDADWPLCSRRVNGKTDELRGRGDTGTGRFLVLLNREFARRATLVQESREAA